MHERCLRIVSVLLLTAVGAAMTMAGQRPFMPLTSADGLSDLVVNKIYKDSQGYVWFGTGLALDRFDGVRIKSVPIPGDNLNQKRVKAIADLGNGELYMGNAEGLFHLDRVSMTLERALADKVKGEVNVLLASGGVLYIGTENGLYQFDRQEGRLRQFLLAPDVMSSSNAVTAMVMTADSMLWLSSADALHRFDPKTHAIDSFEAEHLYSITALAAKDSVIYVGTYGNGIGVFDTEKRRFSETLTAGNNIITSLATAPENSLLAATDGDGILIYSTDNGEVKHHLKYENSDKALLRSNSVYSIYVDDLNLLWVGYYQDGADYLPNRQEVFEVYKYDGFIDTHSHAVRALDIDGSRKMIGTREGLYYIDEVTGRRAKFSTPKIRSNIIFSIKRIGNRYYVGTYNGGMYVFNPQSLELSDFEPGKAPFVNGSIFCIEQSADGDMWIGTSKGVFRYRDGKEKDHFTHSNSQLPAGNVYEIFFDSTGRGWICTERGLAVWNGKELRADGFPQGFANHEKVRDILEDSEHNLYFVPDRGHVFRTSLDLTRFETLENASLVNNRATTFLIEDVEGQLWIGSEAGLARYDKKQTLSYFNSSNGLPNKVFTFCQPVRDANGDLWMGNTRGLVKLDFDKFKHLPKLKSLPVITDLESNGRSVSYRVREGKNTYGITLKPEENNLAISYANHDYVDPSDLIVEYYLEGLESDWNVNSGKNQIRYFDLPPGKYRLHLRQGGDSTSETVLDVRIEKGVNTTMVLLIALILLTGGVAVYFYSKHRNNRIIYEAQAAKIEADRLESEKAAEAERQKRYLTTRLSEEECKRLYRKLETVMKTERPYTNPDLKSADLAAMAGTSAHALSFVFNQWLNKSYYDYVNEYRVNAFKKLVEEEGADKYTLTAMSQKCGFSSRASFFRHFKAVTGITPSEWVAGRGKQ